jgi:hypothetical protein
VEKEEEEEEEKSTEELNDYWCKLNMQPRKLAKLELSSPLNLFISRRHVL